MRCKNSFVSVEAQKRSEIIAALVIFGVFC